MRSNLKNGKLIPPKSYPEAVARHATLIGETARILEHIADPLRRERFVNDEAYNAWRDSARRAFRTFRSEQRQLGAWLDTQYNQLFREAYNLLKTLQKEETIFEEHELELLDRLDAHFGVTKNEQLKETA